MRRSIKFCSLLDLKVLGVIENMAGFVCPHCGEVTHVFSQGGGAAMAAKAGVPFLASVPLDPMIVEAGDAGRPYVYHYSKSPAAQEFAKALVPILALDDENGGRATSSDSLDAEAAARWRACLWVLISTRSSASPFPRATDSSAPHFGHCQEFALIDVDKASNRVLGIDDHSRSRARARAASRLAGRPEEPASSSPEEWGREPSSCSPSRE